MAIGKNINPLKYKRHGHSAGYVITRTYRSWRSMINRCTNPRVHQYRWYGGRGITVCARWQNSFSAFLSDMGERPEGRALDRVNSNGNYEPGNCRWATQIEQTHNSRNFCGIGPRWRDGSCSWVGNTQGDSQRQSGTREKGGERDDS